jgi:hypothetical protein
MNRVRELLESEFHRSFVNSAWLGYGEPLFLGFTKISRTDGNEPSVESAEFKLETNFATWSIEGPICGNSERDNRDSLDSASQSLIGAFVDELELTPDAILTLRFDGSRLLKIIPWPVDEGHSDAWSMTLPDDKILAVSNARHIAIVEKHVPIREWFADLP